MQLNAKTRSLLLLSALCVLGASAYAASDTVLPNGNEFHFWEKTAHVFEDLLRECFQRRRRKSRHAGKTLPNH